jgi:hypothetical protein
MMTKSILVKKKRKNRSYFFISAKEREKRNTYASLVICEHDSLHNHVPSLQVEMKQPLVFICEKNLFRPIV